MTTHAEQTQKRAIVHRFVRFCVCSALLAVATAAPAAAQPRADFDLQAHRGGRGETTEGSLQAFAKSLELGVSTLELDVVLTADRQPLVWHDPTIGSRKCTDTGPAFPGDKQFPYVGDRVHDLTLAQIRTLDCGRSLAEFPGAEAVPHNKIATLPEVFALAERYRADVRFNIETKLEADQPDASAAPQEFVAVILAEVRSAGKIGRVSIQSFDWRTLPMVRRAEPSIPLVALWEPGALGDPLQGASLIGAELVAPPYSDVDRSFVERAHKLGLKVIPWTVNDADAVRAQIRAGVDGVITDYPTMARTVLAELGMPLPPAYRRS